MKSHLKVKVHSMSAEMTYIRRQEEKWKNEARYARIRQKEHASEKALASIKYAEDNFWSHRWHREDMKYEARTAHLAHGCIKGIPYSKMEQLCYGVFKGYGTTEPDWGRMEAMILRFTVDEPNPQDYIQRFGQWLADAKVWYEGNKKRIPAAADVRAARHLALRNDPEFQALKAARSALAEGIGRVSKSRTRVELSQSEQDAIVAFDKGES